MSTATQERHSLVGAKGSLQLLKIEMIITQTNAAASLLIVFQHTIGMTQAQVGYAQAIFTIVLLLATIPTGWLADKVSRKLCNAGGDLIIAVGYIAYAHVSSFGGVVMAEIAVGVGHAFSMGADNALQKGYADETNKKISDIQRFISIGAPMAQIIMVLIGGFAGQKDFSYAFYVGAVPFLIGAILSLFMKESGERYISKHRNPFVDIVRITHSTIRDDSGLRWLFIAHGLGFKMSMPFVLALGPLLVHIGAPLWTLPWVYAGRFFCKTAGAYLSGVYGSNRPPWVRFVIPSTMLALSLGAMVIDLRAVWGAVFIIGLTEGWFSAITTPMILNRASTDIGLGSATNESERQNKKDLLATVGSVADTSAQLVYVLLIVMVSLLAGDNFHMIVAITLIIVVVATFVTIRGMRQLLPDTI